jgi:multiple sugar transport system substrate-binding protein
MDSMHVMHAEGTTSVVSARGTRRRVIGGAAALAGAALAACGAPGGAGDAPRVDAKKQYELRIAIRAGQADTSLWYDLAKGFTAKYPNLKATPEEGPESSGQFAEKMVALTAAGGQPDAMQFSDGPFFKHAARGLYLELDQFVRRDAREVNADDLWPGMLDYWRYDKESRATRKGKLYGVPRSASTELIVYNKKVFREAGVPEPPADGNWTWADFLDRAKKLTRRNGGELTRAAIAPYPFYNTIPQLIANGAPNHADPVKRVSTLNNPQTIEVLRTVANYYVGDKVIPSPTELKTATFQGNERDLLAKGVYAMSIQNAYVARIQQAFKDDPGNWDVTLYPKGSKGLASRGVFNPFAGGSQSKEPAATWELLKYIVSPDGQTTLMKTRLLLSVRKSVAQKIWPDPTTPQNEERWLKSFEHWAFDPLSDVYPEMSQVHDFYWKRVTDDQVRQPVNDALRQADDTINRLFKTGELPVNWNKV